MHQQEETYEEADYCLSVEEITPKHPPNRASQQTIVYSDTEEDEPARP